MCTATCIPAGSSVVGSNAVDQKLIDLICDDPDLLAAEFDAIIAAEWPTPPVECGRLATACRPPAEGQPASMTPGAARIPAASPRHRRMGAAALTASARRSDHSAWKKVIATREVCTGSWSRPPAGATTLRGRRLAPSTDDHGYPAAGALAAAGIGHVIVRHGPVRSLARPPRRGE